MAQHPSTALEAFVAFVGVATGVYGLWARSREAESGVRRFLMLASLSIVPAIILAGLLILARLFRLPFRPESSVAGSLVLTVGILFVAFLFVAAPHLRNVLSSRGRRSYATFMFVLVWVASVWMSAEFAAGI